MAPQRRREAERFAPGLRAISYRGQNRARLLDQLGPAPAQHMAQALGQALGVWQGTQPDPS